MDPFYNECRAYGRLIEKGMYGKVAAHCYGYVTIPAERERELLERFDAEDWGRSEQEEALPVHKRPPLRAIVKELIQKDMVLTGKLVKKILTDLKKMHRVGVYPMDVREPNYKGGLLVDMSVAMTEPHYLFQIRPPFHIIFLKREGLRKFDRMVKKAEIKTWVRAVRNNEYCQKLRSSKDY